MAELWWDNIEAEWCHGTSNISSNQLRSPQRGIPDIFNWLQCFGVFAAGVVASKHPDRESQLLAYQTTIVRKARHCGKAGWQAHDTMFRQHTATNPFVDWSKLNHLCMQLPSWHRVMTGVDAASIAWSETMLVKSVP